MSSYRGRRAGARYLEHPCPRCGSRKDVRVAGKGLVGTGLVCGVCGQAWWREGFVTAYRRRGVVVRVHDDMWWGGLLVVLFEEAL